MLQIAILKVAILSITEQELIYYCLEFKEVYIYLHRLNQYLKVK